MPRSLWILTEERPKKVVLHKILQKFASEQRIAVFFDNLRIIPIVDEDGRFGFTYQILGMSSSAVDRILLKVVSGNSSFVDYLVYFQDDEPRPEQRPLYAIEETKTDDAESRNTGVYQRATKFVYVELFYPGVDATMLYNLQVSQKSSPTNTNIFGTRCLKSLGVKFIGKTEDVALMRPFNSIEELIEVKANMRRPPAGNVPILVERSGDRISVSGRLVKAGSLSHDPNIGAITLICATLRRLGWIGRIEITQHGLTQRQVRPSNKFVQIANHLRLDLEGIEVPEAQFPNHYWHYETRGEKIGTIFVHLVVEEFSKGFSIYENHAGGERGYFFTRDGIPIAVSKRELDSFGVMAADAARIPIPDLVLIDIERLQIVNIEGERSENVRAGIDQLEGFEAIEAGYFRKHYPEFKILRTVVLYGGEGSEVRQVEVSLLLNSRGEIYLGIQAPPLFQESISNLFDYWQVS